jgi:transcriptional regulator of acetoin/glycerol metabolism
VRRIAALYSDLDVLDQRVLTEPLETLMEGAGADDEPISTPPPAPPSEVPASIHLTAAELEERERIVVTLTQCLGNQTKSAKQLGVSRSTLIDRIKRFRIPRPRA